MQQQQKLRKNKSKQFKRKTRTGQPVMSVIINDLVEKIDRQITNEKSSDNNNQTNFQ